VRPVIYYCNPNIYPEEEYLIRKNEITRYAAQLGIRIIDEDSTLASPAPADWQARHDEWLHTVACGLEGEPERGKRCLECFRLRLLRSARKTKELGLTRFTATLASSRWKSLEQINEAGTWAAAQVEGVEFWDRNWRKGGLQQRRNELLRENGFYNQLYCGCEFSMEALKEREARQALNSQITNPKSQLPI